MSFGFASQLLEMRKSYTMKIAEMMSDTQKQAEAHFKAATETVHGAEQRKPEPEPEPPTSRSRSKPSLSNFLLGFRADRSANAERSFFLHR